MTYTSGKPLRLYPYLLISIVVFIIVSSSYIIYQHERKRAIDEKYKNLSSVSSMKAEFLSTWYKERLKEVQYLAENSNFPNEIEQYILSGSYDREHIISHLKPVIVDDRYENVMMVTVDKKMFFSALPNYYRGQSSDSAIEYSLKTGFTNVSDFTYCNSHKKIHLDIISPVKVEDRIVAALILRIDPTTHLFPALQQWPVQSRTAEVILIKQNGDTVQFLNQLRKRDNHMLNFKQPVSSQDSSIKRALSGYEGFYEGKDYTGDLVISDIRSIPGTKWLMLVKININEVLAEFHKRALLIAIVITLITIVVGSVITMGFIRRQKNIYKELLNHRSQLFKTQSELGTTLYAITDGIIVTDENGAIKHMNPGAEKLTGWEENQAIGRKVPEVCSLISEDSYEPVEDLVSKIIRNRKSIAPTNHTLLISQFGKETPISQNGAPIINADGTFTGVVIAINDRTEERQKNKLLKQSEERFYHLFERAPLAYQSLNDKGELIEVNQAWTETFGYSKEEVLGKWFGDFLLPSNVAKLKENFSRFKSSGMVHTEFVMRHSNDDLKDIIVDGRIGYDKDGNFEKTHCIIQDVTEKKRMERELKENERQLSSLISHLPGFVYRCMYDHDWTMLYISNSVEKITGYSANDFSSGRITFNDIIKSEFRELINEKWDIAIQEHSFFELEYVITTASNDEKWIWERGKAVYDENGNVLFLEGYIEDVSIRKNNEMELKESEEKYRLVLDNSLDAILLTKPDGSTLSVNKATAEMFGMHENEICIKGRDGIIDSSDHRLQELLILRNRLGKVKGELNFRKADGTIFPAEISSALFNNSRGEVLSSMIIRDMSLIKENERQLKQLNADLMAAKIKAEESDRLKTAFLANMSHEIRTPMNGILGFLDLLREPDINEETRNEYISFMNLSGQRLLNTINDIIEISKIESGSIEVKMRELDLTKLFEYYHDFFNPQAKEKNLELIFKTQIENGAAIVLSDRPKIDSILTNLIRNAIKFTRKGYVEVGNYRKDNNLVIYVKDTGVGIHPSKQEAIFDRFIQADTQFSRDYEGSGLGLSIVKAYVEALKGTITLTSVPNQGSTFTVEIPYITSFNATARNQPAVVPDKLPNITMLIAEDDEISYRYMQDILKNTGIEIIRAINGGQAVDICKSSSDINIILMDIKMAVLDGYEATKIIRTFNPDIPIIAQTAYAFSEDRDKALSVGCTDYLSKPISKAKLLNIIEKYLDVSNKQTIML